jgi:hypothetical protein
MPGRGPISGAVEVATAVLSIGKGCGVTLNEVLTALRERRPRSVLVTGPQRSGTTIAAHILAQELGRRYVDESEFRVHDHVRAAAILAQGGIVMQGPGICHLAQAYARSGVGIVMMHRSIDDIRRSEERIGWRKDLGGFTLWIEQKKYQATFGLSGDNIASIKYFCWNAFQRQHCNGLDLDYESLKQHPLWNEPSERSRFGPRQWRPQWQS